MGRLTRFGWRGAAAATLAAALIAGAVVLASGGGTIKLGLQPGAKHVYVYPATPKNRTVAAGLDLQGGVRLVYGCTSTGTKCKATQPTGPVESVKVLAATGDRIVTGEPGPGDRIEVTYRPRHGRRETVTWVIPRGGGFHAKVAFLPLKH